MCGKIIAFYRVTRVNKQRLVVVKFMYDYNCERIAQYTHCFITRRGYVPDAAALNNDTTFLHACRSDIFTYIYYYIIVIQ